MQAPGLCRNGVNHSRDCCATTTHPATSRDLRPLNLLLLLLLILHHLLLLLLLLRNKGLTHRLLLLLGQRHDALLHHRSLCVDVLLLEEVAVVVSDQTRLVDE